MVTTIIIILSVLLVISLYKQRKIKQNLNLLVKPNQVSFLPAYETRIRVQATPFKVLIVEFKGELPNEENANLSFSTLLFTLNGKGKRSPVLSLIDTFQNENDRSFNDRFKLGMVDMNSGSHSWQAICTIPLEYIQTAYSGSQSLMIHTTLINDDIDAKLIEDKVIVSNTHHHIFNFEYKGYKEEGGNILEARIELLRLAVSVAFSDGTYHHKEKSYIESWIKKIVAPYDRKQKINTLELLSDSLNAIEIEAREKKLDLNSALQGVRDKGDSLIYFEAIELAIDVMAADGKENHLETEIIKQIANYLIIDENLLNDIKNQKISKLIKPLIKVAA
jgi:tellurite resistance protein